MLQQDTVGESHVQETSGDGVLGLRGRVVEDGGRRGVGRGAGGGGVHETATGAVVAGANLKSAGISHLATTLRQEEISQQRKTKLNKRQRSLGIERCMRV